MIIRTRAWRRRKARIILAQVKATKEWLTQPFIEKAAKFADRERPHRPGKLTRVQMLRQTWALNQELADGP